MNNITRISANVGEDSRLITEVGRRDFLGSCVRASVGLAAGAAALTPSTHLNADDSSAVADNLGILSSPGPVFRAHSVISVPSYLQKIIPEVSATNGDDIVLYYRWPVRSQGAYFFAPAGNAARAYRFTKARGGASFAVERVGSNYFYKIVFGWGARILFGGGYAPRKASNAEARRMGTTYRVVFQS